MAISKLAATRSLRGDEAAAAEILKAVRRARGSRKDAAVALGVSETTLYRVIGELDLWGRLDDLGKKLGFPERAGRARGEAPAEVRRSIRAGRQRSLAG